MRLLSALEVSSFEAVEESFEFLVLSQADSFLFNLFETLDEFGVLLRTKDFFGLRKQAGLDYLIALPARAGMGRRALPSDRVRSTSLRFSLYTPPIPII
jgi:hypothetical protein